MIHDEQEAKVCETQLEKDHKLNKCFLKTEYKV